MIFKCKAFGLAFLQIVVFCPLVFAGGQDNGRILVQDNSEFTVDFYQKLCVSEGNMFFSPFSVSTALGMTYGGARGNTAREMAETLRFSLGQEDLHYAFAQLRSRLNKLQESENIQLSIANSMFPQEGYKFLDEYLSLIKRYYGVSITPLDYKHACEAARKIINKWVEEKTQDKIKDLIQPGILDPLTRLVLVNAIYFKGNWESQFNADKTKDAPFYISPGRSVRTPMMTQKGEFEYGDLKLFDMLELPYVGNGMSMILLLPKEPDGLKCVESKLSLESLRQWKSHLSKRDVIVFLPKFKMTSMFRLDNVFKSMGMVDAFSSSKANFAGMDGRPGRLYIGAVIHKAFIDVNEEGTEAAAATAVGMKATAIPVPPPVFRVDHPFIFLIQAKQTGSILFMGRVADPTGIDK